MRILITGVPGVGKTTVAALVAKKLRLPHITEKFDISWTSEQFANAAFNDYHSNDCGVFEVDPHVSAAIFTNDFTNLHTYGYYDFAFYLATTLGTIQDRILKRARPDFLEIELAECEARWERGIEACKHFELHKVRATAAPEYVSQYITSMIHD